MGQAYEIYEGDNQIDRFEVRDLRVKTRFAIDNRFYDEYTALLGPKVSMVYIALVRHADKDQKTWPSQKRISAQLGISRTWVGKYLNVLKFFNLIKSVRVGKRCNNRYYLTDEKHWRTDFKEMLVQVEKEMDILSKSTDVVVMHPEGASPIGDIRCLEMLHHMLSKIASNSKDKQVRINKKDKNISIKKSSPTPPLSPNQQVFQLDDQPMSASAKAMMQEISKFTKKLPR